MKFFLTGGAGFIGSYLTETLLEKGHSVCCVDNLSTGSYQNILQFVENPNYSFFKADLESFSQLESCIQNTDVIYHLAASVGVKNIIENPIYCIDNNVFCTSQILKNASKHQKRVFTFSTSEVYGRTTKFPSSEDDDLILGPAHKLRWTYAASKLIDDYMARAYFEQNKTAVTTVRLFNTIGQRQVGHYGMVVPRFFDAAVENKTILVHGTGYQSRCFTDVRDVVNALYLLIDCPQSHGELINVGNNNEIAIKDLALKIKEVARSNSKIELIPYRDVYGENFEDMDRRQPDNNKLKRMLNFEFKYNIDETLQWIHSAFNKNGEISNTQRGFTNSSEPLAIV